MLTTLFHAWAGGAVLWTVVATGAAYRRSGEVLARFAVLSPFWPVMALLGLSDALESRWMRRKHVEAPSPVDPALLLEAQREVDEMLPNTPPIAPPRMTEFERERLRGLQNAWPAIQAAQAARQANAGQLVALDASQAQLNASVAALMRPGAYVMTNVSPAEMSRNPLNLVCIGCGGLDQHCGCMPFRYRGGN